MKKFLICSLALVLGVIAGFITLTYIKLPQTEALIITEEVYYSNGEGVSASNESVNLDSADISVHFLELGNKYTGDCTYIKTATADILIDCGSKSNSIPTVKNYLDKYVTDGKLEYVIVTHAHQDHYAGFATTTKIQSIFDYYECETIITFAQTAKGKTDTTMYKNFERELNAEDAAGAVVFNAKECMEGTVKTDLNGTEETQVQAKSSYEIGGGYNLNILDSYYYYNRASSENDHSVCVMVTNGTRNFLFTGDLEAEGEEHLLELNSLPKVDLYKAGHHGSKTSSSPELLQTINPTTICVCCCAGSPEYTDNANNQFPTQEFIDNICDYTTTNDVYVTTLCVDYDNNEFTSFNGDIVYMANAEGYNMAFSNNDIKLKDSEWFKNNRVWKRAA